MNRFNIGDSFETSVVAVTDTTVFVDLNAKSEGVIDVAEFKDDEGNDVIINHDADGTLSDESQRKLWDVPSMILDIVIQMFENKLNLI